MQRQAPRVLICGGGIAGLATALELGRRGYKVDLVVRDTFEGSSFTNQKWRHSGVLYDTPELVGEVWDAYSRMHPVFERPYVVGDPHARFMSSDPALLDFYEERWRRWDLEAQGLIPRRFSIRGDVEEGRLGHTPWIGGFLTPDRVMDYPALMANLLQHLTSCGVRIFGGAVITDLLVESGRATGVRFRDGGREVSLRADHVVVTLGAWTQSFLAKSGLSVPVTLVKSNVLVFPEELVPTITLWLGDQVTLVPYGGATLVADHRWVEVQDPTDRAPHAEHVQLLVEDLRRTFSKWPDLPYSARGCLKTEEIVEGPFPRNPNMAIFDSDRMGVEGLTVAFPGKASLVFTMARRVADSVDLANEKIGASQGKTPILL